MAVSPEPAREDAICCPPDVGLEDGSLQLISDDALAAAASDASLSHSLLSAMAGSDEAVENRDLAAARPRAEAVPGADECAELPECSSPSLERLLGSHARAVYASDAGMDVAVDWDVGCADGCSARARDASLRAVLDASTCANPLDYEQPPERAAADRGGSCRSDADRALASEAEADRAGLCNIAAAQPESLRDRLMVRPKNLSLHLLLDARVLRSTRTLPGGRTQLLRLVLLHESLFDFS